ncbi:MAG: hypothetical protein RLN89_08340 [Parvibaculum sp.]
MRASSVRVLGSFGILVSLLVACTSSAPLAPPEAVEITFQHRAPIMLDIARIEIVDAYEPPLKYPNVEHLHELSPSEVATRWSEDRLRAVGTRGQLTLIIQEASVVEEKISVADGIGGFFRDEPDTRLRGRVRARFDYIDVGPPSRSRAVEVSAEASTEIMESATLNERDLAYLTLVEKLAAEFDKGLTSELESTFSMLIRR